MPIPAALRELEHLTPQQLLDRASRTLPQVLTVVLVIAIAWQLVQLTWLLLDRNEPVAIPLPAPGAGTVTTGPRGADVRKISEANLFGQQEAAQATAATAAPTQMNLVLTAVFATGEPTKGWAVIGESANSTKFYSTGDAIGPGTKLNAVYPDKVILDRNGTLETLAMPVQSLPGMQVARAAGPAPRPQSNFQQNLRRIAETNPGAFAEVVRPQPVFANGAQRGYRVYPGRNRQQFARLGLQPGDLVLAVNGTPLDDPQRGMEIFNTMGSSDRVTITVERNGQPQELSLNTAQVALPEAAAPPEGEPAPGGAPQQPLTPQNGGPETN